MVESHGLMSDINEGEYVGETHNHMVIPLLVHFKIK